MPLATSRAMLYLVSVSMDLFCSCRVLKRDPPATYSVTIANCCNKEMEPYLKIISHFGLGYSYLTCQTSPNTLFIIFQTKIHHTIYKSTQNKSILTLGSCKHAPTNFTMYGESKDPRTDTSLQNISTSLFP